MTCTDVVQSVGCLCQFVSDGCDFDVTLTLVPDKYCSLSVAFMFERCYLDVFISAE